MLFYTYSYVTLLIFSFIFIFYIQIESYLPAVQTWQDEWGAQAIPLTHARWLLSLATGVHGTRTSRIITSQASIATVAK